MNTSIKTSMLLILMTLTLAKTAKADPDCSKISSYKLKAYQRMTLEESQRPVRFILDAVSKKNNEATSCIELKEIKDDNAKFYIDSHEDAYSWEECTNFSFMVEHYDENKNLLKVEFAVMPFETIYRHRRADNALYTNAEDLAAGGDLLAPLAALVVGPIVSAGDSAIESAQGDVKRRTQENKRDAYNKVLQILDLNTSLKQCEK